MDDDGNRTLDFAEFKKGLREYGLILEPKVNLTDQSGRTLLLFLIK